MGEIGIRALKQNASAVVAAAAAGEIMTITDRGRPVARLAPLAPTHLEELVRTGAARPARRKISDLPAPTPGAELTSTVIAARDDERF